MRQQRARQIDLFQNTDPPQVTPMACFGGDVHVRILDSVISMGYDASSMGPRGPCRRDGSLLRSGASGGWLPMEENEGAEEKRP